MTFLELTNQTAIVTGAATGIGEAIAERLAAAGATVAIADLNPDAANNTAKRIGNGAFGVGCNVGDEASVGKAVAEVLQRTGRIDILVNNAGIAGKAAPV